MTMSMGLPPLPPQLRLSALTPISEAAADWPSVQRLLMAYPRKLSELTVVGVGSRFAVVAPRVV